MAIIVSMQDTMKECAKEFSVDMDDLKSKLKSHEGLDSIDKCFFQCIFKKKDAVSCDKTLYIDVRASVKINPWSLWTINAQWIISTFQAIVSLSFGYVLGVESFCMCNLVLMIIILT